MGFLLFFPFLAGATVSRVCVFPLRDCMFGLWHVTISGTFNAGTMSLTA